jgi:hypothetical protein
VVKNVRVQPTHLLFDRSNVPIRALKVFDSLAHQIRQVLEHGDGQTQSRQLEDRRAGSPHKLQRQWILDEGQGIKERRCTWCAKRTSISLGLNGFRNESWAQVNFPVLRKDMWIR